MGRKILVTESQLRYIVENINRVDEQVVVSSDVFGDYVDTYKLHDLPNAIKNYDPSKGYIRIDGGNEWLANSRSNSLKNLLIQNMSKKLGLKNFGENNIKIEKAEVLGSGNENQYVIGTLYGTMSKPPQTQEEYPFQIWYNFYDIGGIPHIIITKRGKGLLPHKSERNEEIDDLYLKRGIKSVGVDNFIAVKQKHPQTIRYATLLPINKNMGYISWKNGILYFDDEEKYNNVRNFINEFTEGNPEITKNNAQTRYIKTSGGGGNYMIGTEDGLKNTIIYGKNKGKEIIIKRQIVGKEGNIPGETKEGSKEEWFKFGDIKLDQNFFEDNMISLLPNTYDKIFSEINKIIAQKVGIGGFEEKSLKIKVSIKGFASSDNATNRLPKGVEKPDHTYGNRVPVDKWIKVG